MAAILNIVNIIIAIAGMITNVRKALPDGAVENLAGHTRTIVAAFGKGGNLADVEASSEAIGGALAHVAQNLGNVDSPSGKMG